MSPMIAMYISMAYFLCVYAYILWNVTSEKRINKHLAVSLYFSSMLLIFLSVCFLWYDTVISGPPIFVYSVSVFYAVLYVYLMRETLKEIAINKEIKELKRQLK